MKMRIWLGLVFALILCTTAGPMWAGPVSVTINIPECEAPDEATGQKLNAVIINCRALIASGQLTGPSQTWAYVKLGNLYAYEADYDNAILFYTNAIRLSPRFALAYYNRGLAYVAQQKLIQALNDIEIASVLDPSNPRILLDLGLILNKLGDYDQAIAAYKIAVTLDSEMAIKEFERDITQDHNNSVAIIGRGLVYNATGKYDIAIIDFNTAIDLNPKLSLAYANRGEAKWALGDDVGAIEDLQTALKLDPNLSSAREKLDSYLKILADRKRRNETPMVAGKRVALVIGISHYDRLPVLDNADGDAEAVADVLKHQNYQVTLITSSHDPQLIYNAEHLKAAIEDFRNSAVPGAESAVVWYTGHGKAVISKPSKATKEGVTPSQIDDFLLPADFKSGDDPIAKGVDVLRLTSAAAAVGKLGAVFIDACRSVAGDNGPEGFRNIRERSSNGHGGSLYRDHLVVVYSAQPGKNASDGIKGQHSPFAAAFLEGLNKGAAKRDITSFTANLQRRTQSIAQDSTNTEQEPVILNGIEGWHQPSLAVGNDPRGLALAQVR